MFAVSVESKFRASHYLTSPDGTKEVEHEHNWQVVAQVNSESLNETGVVVDFVRLKKKLDGVVAELDGKKLEDVEYFKNRQQSTENAAKYIYEKLKSCLAEDVKLDYIEVTERGSFRAKFSD